MSANRFFGASIAAMVVAAVPSAAYAQQTYSFDVPAEKLADSLRAIGARSGTSIAFDPALTRGKKAPAIKGVMGVNQALSTALSGSGLEARTSASGYIVAAHAADLGNAVAGGPNAGNKNPPSSLGESSGAAAVNEKPQESEIIVTGSHIRHAEPLSRIITTTRQQIQTSGYTSIAGYVQNLPQQFPGVSAQYNGLTATSNDADNNDAGSAGFDLRGLGPEATLVLLNGQRTASAVGSNVFDISALPVSLLDRIEILTDGASAIYGSDAVAGVVNIITRRDFVGLETDFDTNVETRTGHAGFGATLLGGFKWNSGNIAASYNHQSSIGLNASDRSFSYASDPRTTLVPAQNSDSGFVTLTQRILPDLILTSDNILSQRRNSQYNGFYDESLANRVAKLGSTEKLSYDFGHDWNASLFGSYSWEKYRDRLIYGFSTSTPFIGHAVQTARYADISPQIGGPLFKLPGGNVRIALGADYRRDSFTMTDSSSTSKQRRHVFAAFGEVLFPFIAPEQGIPGIRRLSLDASDRWDHYSDFGSTNNPKVSAVWSPFLGLEFHGSYGTSFRAPDLTSLENGNPVYVVYYDVPDPAIGGNLAPALYSYGANPNLKPETARSLTFGAKATLGGDHTFSIDYFKTHYTNRIIFLINEAGTNFLEQPRFSQFVTTNPSLAQINAFISQPGSQFYNLTSPMVDPSAAVAIANLGYANAGTTDIAGLDFAATTTFGALDGSLHLYGAATYFLHYKQRIGAVGPYTSLVGEKYYPSRFKGLAAADYLRGNWDLHVQGNYSSPYNDTSDVACALSPCPISSQFTLDAALSLQIPTGQRALSGTALTLAVQNIFDVSPPYVNDQFGLGYDPSHTTPLGRVISVSLRKKW